MMKHVNESGQSFFSVIILVLIAGLSGSIAYIQLSGLQMPHSSFETLDKLETIKNAILTFESNVGSKPTALSELITAQSPGCSVDTNTNSSSYRSLQGWCGPYLKIPLDDQTFYYFSDSWGTPLQYSPTRLLSCGPNRICGDSDDIQLAF